MNKPNFKTDLARGHLGEVLFHRLRPELARLDGRQADFVGPDGKISGRRARQALKETNP